ncbi:MAG TPA: branched-chain-amino-acid transaminase [Candidatus Limnocylindrales bacterium]|nr:branched-chain-amino-acid transaminase [Candidatus Limnocylindrales bacterium]
MSEKMGFAGEGFEPAPWIWRNGEIVAWPQAVVHVNAVGHASVAAVFEGIKAYLSDDGERLLVFRLDDHLRRLHRSARICRLSLPYTLAQLRAAVGDLLAANGFRHDVYIRPWAFPSGMIREQMVPAGSTCEVVVDSWPCHTELADLRGARAAVSSWQRITEASMPPRVKAFSNYHNGRMALLEAKENGHDLPIMLNERHKVSEGAGACLALVLGDTVVTPSLTSGVLDGITRATMVELLREEGWEVQEREVDRTELYLADEVFFMGTAWEIVPVVAVDGLTVGHGSPGPVTRHLADLYHSLVRGRSGKHAEWLTQMAIR